MRKRMKKKLYTDKTFGGTRVYISKGMKNLKVQKALIKEGKISVGRIDLGVSYKEMKV